MKKIAVIFIILAAFFVCSGCAEMTYGVYIKSNGSVEKKYQVIIDENANFAPYTADYALTIARAQLEYMLEQGDDGHGEIVENDENEYDISLVYKYDDLNEYYRTLGITGDDEPEPETGTKEESFLFIESTDGVFTDIDSLFVTSQANQFKQLYFNQMNNAAISNSVVNLEYGTPYTKSYSANSDETFVDNKMRVFKWSYDLYDIDTDRYLTVRQPNYAIWYAVSVVSSLIISVVLAVIFKRRKDINGREQISL